MTLRPPDPTTNRPTAKEEAARHRRAAIIPVAIGLAVVLTLAGLSAFRKATDVKTYTYATDDLSHQPDAAGDLADPGMMDLPGMERPNPLQGLSVNSSLDELLMLRPDDQALSAEPLDLAPHPQGRRLGGFMRIGGSMTEEVVMWKVDVSNPSDAMTHYLNAASELFFEPLPRQPAQASSTPGVISQILTRKQRSRSKEEKPLPTGNDILLIRARPTTDGQVLATLWYRCAAVDSRTIVLPP